MPFQWRNSLLVSISHHGHRSDTWSHVTPRSTLAGVKGQPTDSTSPTRKSPASVIGSD